VTRPLADRCVRGSRPARRLVATPLLANALVPDSGFVPPWRNRDGMGAWVTDHAGTTFHPSSSCRMGPAGDQGAVLNHCRRLHGVANLRVGDASIFPASPRANLQCTVVAVAEKLADAIRGGDAA
jgi:choline dehydrogenase